jgi:hypothetical protein
VSAAPPRADELAAEQAQAELTVAPEVVRRVPLRGRVVRGEARSCQHARCAPIRQAQGHYRFVSTANQPELFTEVARLFAQPPPGERFATARRRRTQRDRHAVRTRTASAALVDYRAELGGAGAQQVARRESVVRHVRGVRAGQTTRLVRSFLTSRSAPVPAHPLVRLIRAHWHSENRLHDVRDVPFGEDASQVRSGATPQARAALRNAV